MAGRNIKIVIEGDGASAQRALEMVREQMQQTAEKSKESGGEIEKALEKVGHALEWIGLYEGLRKVVDGFKELAVGSVELGVELGHLHEQTGISVQNLSVMKYMADETGVGFDTLTKGFRMFSRQILEADEGQKTAIANFNRIGISQAEVKKSGTDMLGMLGLVADKFKSLPNDTLKGAEAQLLFGKSGAALIPILNQGKDGIASFEAEARSLGLVLDEQGVEKMEALHRAAVRVEGGLQGAALGITAGLEPALMDLFQAFNGATDRGEAFNQMGEKLGEWVLGAANGVAYLAKFIRQAKDEWVAFGALGNTVDSKLDSIFDVGSGARARAREANAAAKAAEDAALKDRDQAQKDYDDFANRLAKGLPTGGADGTVMLGNGNLATKRKKGGDGADGTIDLQPPTGHVHSDNGIAQAQAALAEQEAQSAAAAQKDVDQVALAQLEARHKLMLISDQEFYAQKLKLQVDALNAEESALQTKLQDLAALQARQHNDKTLKRDKSGNSSEELRTLQESQRVMDQMNALDAKRKELTAAAGAESGVTANAQQLASLKIAAELEKEQNAGLEKQIELIRKEHELEAQKIQQQGGSSADVANERALGEIAVKKLEIDDITKKITASEDANRRAVEALNDAAAKDPRLKNKTEQEINKLNQAEAASLRELVAQYTALANVLGGEYLQKAQDLQAELNKLNTPSEKGPSKQAKQMGDTMSSMIQRITENAATGSESFHKMVQSIEKDLVDLAVKMAAEKWLTPMLENMGGSGGGFWASLFGASAEHHLSGGLSSGGPQVVGEEGPEIWTPPESGGTVVPNGMATQLAKSGGGGGSPNITTNVINQSRQPVQAQPSQVNYDSEGKQWVINTILEDHAQGGPTSALGAGGGAG